MDPNKKNQRPVDRLANESYHWLRKGWTFIKKKDLLNWRMAIIAAFIMGGFVAIAMVVKVRLETSSVASSPQATLSLVPSSSTVADGSSFSVNVALNTGGSSVVATTAVVAYNPSQLQLTSYDLSGSVFTPNNACTISGSPCQLVQNDTTDGNISITMAEPSPGINTASGTFAKLNFQTLQTGSAPITISYTSPSTYTNSNVILGDGNGTGILSSVSNTTITIAAPVCTSFTYSAWSTCANGTQTRTVTASTPTGCAGGSPTLTQSCTVAAPTCTSFTYSAWGTCTNNSQTRTVTKSSPSGCAGGSPVLTQSCTPPTCMGFSYGPWSACQPNGTKTRTATGTSPAGCVGGTPAVTSMSCTYKS